MMYQHATATDAGLQSWAGLIQNPSMAKKKSTGRASHRAELKYHNIHPVLMDLFNSSGLTQKEMAAKLGWFEKDGEANQKKVSKLLTGQRFNLEVIEDFCHNGCGITLVDLFIGAATYMPQTLKQSEIGSIMEDLSETEQESLLAAARSMRKSALEVRKLKERVKAKARK